MEFAIGVPMLLAVTVGLVDFGRGAYEAIAVENAAYAGVTFGARNADTALDTNGIKTAALNEINENLDSKSVTVVSERTCECPDGSSVDCSTKCTGVTPLMYLRVRVDKKFQTFLAYPGIPKEIPFAREAKLRIR